MSEWTNVLLERIALALERQVEQVDQAVERNARLRAEGLERHERERTETDALNQLASGQMERVLALCANAEALNKQSLALIEKTKSGPHD
jgi:hypothetical protein